MKIKILSILFFSLILTGCPFDGDDGQTGPAGPEGKAGPQGDAGPQGAAGPAGSNGINCWDLNGNSVNDTDEDVNGDNAWTAADCVASVSIPQNPDAEHNFHEFCKAFAELGKYPDGCPSSTHATPTGTLTQMNRSLFDSSNSACGGALSIDSTSYPGEAYWVLQGGFIADTEVIAVQDRNQCETKCANDNRCIAAHFCRECTTPPSSGQCTTFYHSDTIPDYEHVCGIDIAGFQASEFCLDVSAEWWVTCP